MKMLARPTERQMAVVTAATGLAVSANIKKVTKMMWAIVRNLVQPARISVRQFVLKWASSSYFANKCIS